MEKAVTLVML